MTDPSPRGVAPSHRITEAADDWPVQATDAIVDLVDSVRDKTTGPALAAARAIVIGSVAATLAAVLGVMGLILLIRLLNEVLDLWLPREVAVWVTYAALGTIFVLSGLLLWRRRVPAASLSQVSA